MTTPFEMLTILDDALASAPRGRRRIALELRARRVLGVVGTPLGNDDRGPVFGFTRRQCEEMRAAIIAAAHEDAEAARGE